MNAIRAVASYVPEARIDNLARAAEFGVSEEFIRDKTGALRVARRRTWHWPPCARWLTRRALHPAMSD
jgi:hypothetical protein